MCHHYLNRIQNPCRDRALEGLSLKDNLHASTCKYKCTLSYLGTHLHFYSPNLMKKHNIMLEFFCIATDRMYTTMARCNLLQNITNMELCRMHFEGSVSHSIESSARLLLHAARDYSLSSLSFQPLCGFAMIHSLISMTVAPCS